MRRFQFEGHSDDTFGEYRETGIDYDNCASGTPISFRLDSSEGSMIVIGQYSRLNNGSWDIGIAQIEDGYGSHLSIPKWNMQFSSDGYSVVLEIEAPNDTVLTCLNIVEELEAAAKKEMN